MKINEIKQCSIGQELPKTKAAEGGPGEFNRVLAEESEKMGDAAKSVEGGAELDALLPVMRFSLAAVRNDFSDVYQQAELAVEGAIYRLEQLQMALQHPGGGLRNVGVAIDDLCSGAEGLQQSVASLPHTHLLRQMADELSVLAHVETVKYRRGDYL